MVSGYNTRTVSTSSIKLHSSEAEPTLKAELSGARVIIHQQSREIQELKNLLQQATDIEMVLESSLDNARGVAIQKDVEAGQLRTVLREEERKLTFMLEYMARSITRLQDQIREMHAEASKQQEHTDLALEAARTETERLQREKVTTEELLSESRERQEQIARAAQKD